MKFMLLLKATEKTESNAMPTDEELNTMGRYNDELIKAGAMLAGEGLHPSADGARVDFSGDDTSVTNGPFSEINEMIAGFWILDLPSLQDAIEWTRRVPLTEGRIEIRQVFEVSEFDQDNEYVQKEAQWRAENQAGGSGY